MSDLPFPMGPDAPGDPSRYRLHEDREASDPAFHFALALPAQFQPVRTPRGVPSEQTPIATLGHWRDPDDALPPFEVQVYATEIQREVSGADFMEFFFEAQGIEVLERRIVPGPKAGDRLDALTRRTVRDLTIVSRWFVLKDGGDQKGIVVFAEARTTEANYPSVASDVFRAIAHFKLLNPSGWPYAERLRSVTAARPGDFLTYHPLSWASSPERADDTLEGQHVVMINNVDDDVLTGQIEIRTRGDETSPEQILGDYLARLMAKDIRAETSALAPVEPFAGLEEVWATAGHGYAASGEEGAPTFDIRATIGRRESCHYLIALCGYSRRDLIAHASANHRAYEIVLDRLRTEAAAPPEESSDAEPPTS